MGKKAGAVAPPKLYAVSSVMARIEPEPPDKIIVGSGGKLMMKWTILTSGNGKINLPPPVRNARSRSLNSSKKCQGITRK